LTSIILKRLRLKRFQSNLSSSNYRSC